MQGMNTSLFTMCFEVDCPWQPCLALDLSALYPTEEDFLFFSDWCLILTLGILRQEDWKFQVSPSNTVRPCFKNKHYRNRKGTDKGLWRSFVESLLCRESWVSSALVFISSPVALWDRCTHLGVGGRLLWGFLRIHAWEESCCTSVCGSSCLDRNYSADTQSPI